MSVDTLATLGGLVASLGAFYLMLDRKIGSLDTKFEAKFDALDKKFDTKIDALDKKIETKIDALDTKIDALDAKLDSKIDTQSAKTDSLEERLVARMDLHRSELRDEIKQSAATVIAMVDARFETIDHRLHAVETDLTIIKTRLISESVA